MEWWIVWYKEFLIAVALLSFMLGIATTLIFEMIVDRERRKDEGRREHS